MIQERSFLRKHAKKIVAATLVFILCMEMTRVYIDKSTNDIFSKLFQEQVVDMIPNSNIIKVDFTGTSRLVEFKTQLVLEEPMDFFYVQAIDYLSCQIIQSPFSKNIDHIKYRIYDKANELIRELWIRKDNCTNFTYTLPVGV